MVFISSHRLRMCARRFLFFSSICIGLLTVPVLCLPDNVWKCEQIKKDENKKRNRSRDTMASISLLLLLADDVDMMIALNMKWFDFVFHVVSLRVAVFICGCSVCLNVFSFFCSFNMMFCSVYFKQLRL